MFVLSMSGSRQVGCASNTVVTAVQSARRVAVGRHAMCEELREVARLRVFVDAVAAQERGRVLRAAAHERWSVWGGLL